MHKKGKNNLSERLKLSIFAALMKELCYIVFVLFSSLIIIISGVGVSIVHYCRTRCETTQSCCSSGCSKCEKNYSSSKDTHEDMGCMTVHYKVNWVKYAQDSSPVVPNIMLCCSQYSLPDYSMPMAGYRFDI